MHTGKNELSPEMAREIHELVIAIRARAGGKLAGIRETEIRAAMAVEVAREHLRKERIAPSRAELLLGTRLNTKRGGKEMDRNDQMGSTTDIGTVETLKRLAEQKGVQLSERTLEKIRHELLKDRVIAKLEAIVEKGEEKI